MIDLALFNKQKAEGTVQAVKLGDNYMLSSQLFDSTNGKRLPDIISAISLQEYRDVLKQLNLQIGYIEDFIAYCEGL